MRGAVKVRAAGIFGRVVLAGLEEGLRLKGLRPDRVGDELTQGLSLNDGQALDLMLPDGGAITFTGAKAGLVIDAPAALGLGVALGGGAVDMKDGRSRWTLPLGVYGPAKLHGLLFSVEVHP